MNCIFFLFLDTTYLSLLLLFLLSQTLIMSIREKIKCGSVGNDEMRGHQQFLPVLVLVLVLVLVVWVSSLLVMDQISVIVGSMALFYFGFCLLHCHAQEQETTTRSSSSSSNNNKHNDINKENNHKKQQRKTTTKTIKPLRHRHLRCKYHNKNNS